MYVCMRERKKKDNNNNKGLEHRGTEREREEERPSAAVAEMVANRDAM